MSDRLAAAFGVATGRAEVAADAGARAARAVHARAAALAVEELAQQVVLGWLARLEDARPPGADLLHAVEQLFADERLVQAADGAVLAAQPADVAAVGGVDEHLADGVLAEGAVLRGARAAGVEPFGERAIGFVPGRVALEELADELCSFGVGDGEPGVAVADVAPGERADEMALASLLAQAGARPERERDGVVLVEHLVDRLGEEERWIGGVVADRLRDRDDADAEPVAKQGLVAARLGLVPREARGVVDEHDVEAALGGVGHQPLELGPAVGLLPAAVEVDVVVDELELVLVGEAADRLSLRVGREALALLLGRLAHVRDGASPTRLVAVAPRSLRRSGAGATSRRTSGRRLRLRGAVPRSAHGRSSSFPDSARRHPR